MSERMKEESKVLLNFERLLSTLKRWANKDWARLVPAAAVIPAVRVVATFIRSKTFVAGFVSSL